MAKFKVGDVVRLKVEPRVRIHILETVTQLCYANCEQEWYTGRVYRKPTMGLELGNLGMDVGKMEKFSLIELEAIPPADPKIKALEKEIKAKEKSKVIFIKNQDFEKASQVRHEIEVLKYNIKQLGGDDV